MTYILGWKKNNVVYLIADSAVTEQNGLKSIQPLESSFNEGVFETKNGRVFEGLLKIINIQNKIVVAICGDIKLCNSVLETLNHNVSINYHEPYKALENTIKSCGPFDTTSNIKLIIAIPYLEKGPKLYTFNILYDEAKLYEIEDEVVVKAGPLPNFLHQLNTFIVRNLNVPEFYKFPHKYLISTIAAVQSNVLYENTIEKGIGGTISGVLVTNNTIEWPKDSLYIISNNSFKPDGLVSVSVKDNSYFVDSTFNPYSKCLMNDNSGKLINELKEKWDDEFRNNFVVNDKYCFIILINSEINNLIVFEMLGKKKSKDFELTTKKLTSKDGKYTFLINFRFSPNVKDAFSIPYTKTQDKNAINFKFTYFPNSYP